MNASADARFDTANLYREEVYTDRRVGTLRVLVPVRTDGSADAARATLYVGQISVMTPMGTPYEATSSSRSPRAEASGSSGNSKTRS